MTLTKLSRMYHLLSPAERFPMIFAATERGDEVESLRLKHSAPKVAWKVANYFGFMQAFSTTYSVYSMEQLNRLVEYFHACTKLMDEEDEHPRIWHLVMQTNAYVFAVNREAWRKLVAEIGLDPELAGVLVERKDGWSITGMADEKMAQIAPSTEELKTLFREQDEPRDIEPMTAESQLAIWRDMFNGFVAQWS